MLLFILYSILFVMMLCMIMALGIVWRAEQRLDKSFKFFAIMIFFVLVGVSMDITTESLQLPENHLIVKYFQLLAAIFLLFGIWEMRQIVRELDGELQRQKERKRKLSSRR